MAAITTTKKNTTTNNKKGVGKNVKEKRSPKRLKKYRMDSGYTIYSLADRLGVNYSTISYWENGVKHPRHSMIMELEDLFGTTYRDLFTDLTQEEIEEIEQRIKEGNN